MLRKVLVVQQRVFGPEHPYTLRTAMYLADTVDRQGEHAEAETMLRKALVVQQCVFGPEHPDTLNMANNLAAMLDRRTSDGQSR